MMLPTVDDEIQRDIILTFVNRAVTPPRVYFRQAPPLWMFFLCLILGG